MKRVTGLGGMFFRTRDPKETIDWYRTRLGIDAAVQRRQFALQLAVALKAFGT